MPDPVLQAAKHFWDTALAQSRRLDFDQCLQEGMAAAVANVEAEKARSVQAGTSAFEVVARGHASPTGTV